MRNDFEPLNRRSFLRLAGTAAAANSSLLRARLFAQTEEAPDTNRATPQNAVVLRSPELELTLDRDDGLPFSYRLTGNGAVLHGEDLGKQLGAIVCRKNPWQFSLLPLKSTRATVTQSSAGFAFQTSADATRTTSFTLRYELHGTTVILTLDDITEAEGYELISVEIPRLVTVNETNSNAWL